MPEIQPDGGDVPIATEPGETDVLETLLEMDKSDPEMLRELIQRRGRLLHAPMSVAQNSLAVNDFESRSDVIVQCGAMYPASRCLPFLQSKVSIRNSTPADTCLIPVSGVS